MLVPLMVLYRSGIGQDEYTATPGPARSTWPPRPGRLRAENAAICSCESTAATAMTLGLLAGAPTNPGSVGRVALFPAAAMMREPRASARRPAIVYGGCGRATSAPNDIEMTAQPFATAQLMPARMPASEPEPWLLRTLPAKISAS